MRSPSAHDGHRELPKTTVLVLGGSGMLGHKLVQVLGADERVELHATLRTEPAPEAPLCQHYHVGVDAVRDDAALRSVIEAVAPDVIINAIGVIKQQHPDRDPTQAFFVNGTLPHTLGFLNPNPNGRVVTFSTDCVFDGTRGHYAEVDRPDALDVYGRSKACGEIDYGRHLTVRTSIIGFELRGYQSLLSWLIAHPAGARVPGYVQAIYSGLPTRTLARVVRDLILDCSSLSGLFHVSSQPISKYDLLRRVGDALELGITVVPDDTVRIDRSLSDDRFRATTSTSTPSWDELIDELVLDFHSLPYRDLYDSMRHST